MKKKKGNFIRWIVLSLACENTPVLLETLVLLVMLQMVQRDFSEQKKPHSSSHLNMHQKNIREGIARQFPLHFQHNLHLHSSVTDMPSSLYHLQ